MWESLSDTGPLSDPPAAALFDYRATPKRFTPGWEHVLTARGMAVVYRAMATGFAVAGRRRS